MWITVRIINAILKINTAHFFLYYTNCSLNTNIQVFHYFLLQKMDKENQINDKLKIMKFSLQPCGLKHTQFFLNLNTEIGMLFKFLKFRFLNL